jgi:hypothetical protein
MKRLPSMRPLALADRLRIASAAASFLAAALLPVLARAAEPQLTVVAPPTEAPRASSFWLRVRITNGGAEALRPCNTAEDAPAPDTPCFAVAYRRDKRPPQLRFSRVETAPVLAQGGFVPPGETMERLVRIPTASRGREQSIFVYLVTGAGGRFEWTEVPLRLRLGPAPTSVRLTVWLAWSLLGLYLVLTGWLITRVTRPRSASKA